MISKAKKISLYAERFVELIKIAQESQMGDDKEFAHTQALKEFNRLASLINGGELEEAVKLFDLLRTEGIFSDENGADIMPTLVSNDNFKKFDEAYGNFKFEQRMQKGLN